MSFAHLHVHTSYSLLDGISKREDLIKKAKEFGNPAVAITDHGSLANHISAYKMGKEHNVKVILGIEAFMAPDSRHNKDFKKADIEERGDLSKSAYHLTILAKNALGYQNLIKLSTLAYREGFYRKPRMDLEILNQYKEGLIILSGCLSSITSQYILANQQALALEHINRYRYMFGEDFYLEVMEHDLPAEKLVCEALVHIGKTQGIPVVLTNDSHFTMKEDAQAQEAALCLNGKMTLLDPDHWKFDGSGYWFKSPAEMTDIIRRNSWPEEAYTNTLAIANKIEDYAFKTGKHMVPLFKDKAGRTWDSVESHQKLAMMAFDGLDKMGLSDNAEYTKRLAQELDVMERKNFSSYFLIIADIIEYMKREGILKPFGRGSSVGSLVCYTTGITGMDPIRWGVPFERFINEGRKDLPDVDTDMSQRHRQKVLNYIADKYGRDNVAIIATYAQMSVKSVIDNVGRVLGIPSQVRREVSKVIGDLDKDDKLADVLRDNDKAKKLMDFHPLWIDIATRLEGNYRNVGVHAAGVVISNDPIWLHVPLGRDHKDDEKSKETGFLTTQYDMNDVQALGLLKLDMLGLKTLDVISDTIDLVKQQTGEFIDVHAMNDLNDPSAYKILASGEYVSTFQGDSAGYRALGRRLNPETFEHIMAFTALFRPGPMMPEKFKDPKTGRETKGPSILDHYIARRHGREPSDVWHPQLATVMERSYGMPLYQEQVVQITKTIAGFTEEEGDTFRKAIGKKDQVLFDKMAAVLIEKGMQKGHSKDFMQGLAQKLSGSARYSWNLGHSAGYGKITYLTGLLEAKYPLQYYVALLNAEDKTENMAVLLARTMQKGVEVRPPHINSSSNIFTTDGHLIYMGLESVRGVGDIAIRAIMAERARGPFLSFLDFCRRIQPEAGRAVNKTVKENLVKAGAFTWDDMISDADKLACIERIQNVLKKKPYAEDVAILCACELTNREITKTERAEFEREVLSFYISGHPLTSYMAMGSLFAADDWNIITVSQLKEVGVSRNVAMMGMITGCEIRLSKRGTQFAKLSVQDQFVSTTCVVFDEELAIRLGAQLTKGTIVAIRGVTTESNFRDGEIDIKVQDVVQLSAGIPIIAVNVDDSRPLDYYKTYFNQDSWQSVQSQPSNRWLAAFKQQLFVNPAHLDQIATQLAGARLVLGRS
jgi:DNA polymerase III subunit alpha